MSFASQATRRLMWKEFRQLMPLMFGAPLLFIVLHLVLLLQKNQETRILILHATLVGLPGLFAIGVGALLVGHEKEQRTMQWLTSLPIARPTLIRTKLGIGLACLAIMWVLSMLLVTLFSGGYFWRSTSFTALSFSENLSMVLHSLFLLLIGVALSWRCQSPLTALILLVPLAFVPLLLAALVVAIAAPEGDEARSHLYMISLIVSQLLGCVAAAYWGWTEANCMLRAQSSLGQSRVDAPSSVMLGSPMTPLRALLWQFVKQNRTALIGLTTMIVASLLVVYLSILYGYQWERRSNSEFGIASLVIAVGVLALLSVSWLGVLVFQSDRPNRRIRFLADRGISPGLTWVSRQAAPVSILSLVLPCLVVLIALTLIKSEQAPGANVTDLWNPLTNLVFALSLPALLMAIAVYTISQWSSQVISSPVVAAIVAPLISLIAIGYLWFAVWELEAPTLIVTGLIVIPMLVTRILTRSWMDLAPTWGYWLTHSVVAVLFLLLPAQPVLLNWMRTPSLSKDTEQQIQSQLSRMSLSTWKPVELLVKLPKEEELALGSTEVDESPDDMNDEDSFSSALTTQPPKLSEMSISQRRDYARRSLADQVMQHNGSLRANIDIVLLLKIELEMTRLSGEEDTYVQLIGLASTIAQRMRQSFYLIDQELADRLEIVLLRELRQPGNSALLAGDTTAREALMRLGDRSARQLARQRALAAAWWTLKGSGVRSNHDLLVDVHQVNNIRQILAMRGRVIQAIELLWRLSQFNSVYPSSTTVRNELARLKNVSASVYGIGPGGELLRAEDVDQYILDSKESDRLQFVGSQWGAGWESQAQQLASSISAAPVPKQED